MVQFIIISFLCSSILYCSLMKSEAVVFSPHHLCHPDDAFSLLQFRKDMFHINDFYEFLDCFSVTSKMMRWNNDSSDCCTWNGVTCHQITGRVIRLHLGCSGLMGIIHQNSTLFHLSHLQELSLVHNGLHGNIPSKLSHLSELISLDLSGNYFLRFIPGDFQIFLRNLTRITNLNLNGVQIPTSSQTNWSSSLIYLDLGNTGVDGKLFNSIFHLRQLQKLILDQNENLRGALVDGIACSFPYMKHLDLTDCGLSGTFTNCIGNFSQMVYLYLGRNNFTGDISMIILNLQKLRALELDSNSFSGEIPSYIGNLTELTFIDLRLNLLRGSLPSNMSRLQKLDLLDLSKNELDGTIPSWLFSAPSLRYLDMSDNHFEGQIKEFKELLSKSLLDVNFRGNQLDGPIPDSIFQLVNLQDLDFGDNQLDGPIPNSISQLVNLENLDFEGNKLDGPIPNSMSQLVNLYSLHFGGNQLNGHIPDSISQLVNLKFLHFGGNQLYGPISYSIFKLKDLSHLYLQSNNLSGSVEFIMFSHLKHLQHLDLSNNELSLKIETKINVFFPDFSTLRLSSCEITEIPYFLKNSTNLGYLDISNNKIHGHIPNWIPKGLRFFNLSHNSLSSLESFSTLSFMKNLKILDLRANQFQESLPLSICSLVKLSILDLSHNNFNSSIPECFGNFSARLQVMNLAKNDLKGAISMKFPKHGCQLLHFNLNGNSLEGSLPTSLANCKSLKILDVGNNKINDTFPTFLEKLVGLQVLIFKSNRFFGNISNFKYENFPPKLLVFDLSCNEFSGALPEELFKSLKAMATLGQIEPRASYFRRSGSIYHYSMSIDVIDRDIVVLDKSLTTYFQGSGSVYHYSMSINVIDEDLFELVKMLTTFVVIDLSINNFTGEIPEIIGNLNLIIALNLSHNNISGHMPSTLGRLHFLESLDLSWNKIEGEIPWELTNITNLEYLNLSKNHLQGHIPQGKQFNKFLNDSYSGNFGLCGFPVTKDCGEIDLLLPPSGDPNEDDEDSSFRAAFTWKSGLTGYGFGFAIGCLILFIVKPKWLSRNIEEVCWNVLLLLGKMENMGELIMKKSSRKHYRINNEYSNVPYLQHFNFSQSS